MRINELARELEVKARAILDYLAEIGIADKRSHSSSIDEELAEKVKAHFREIPEAPAPEPSEPAPVAPPPEKIPAGDLESFVRQLSSMPRLQVEGVYTHFANIEDTLDPSFAHLQLERFQDALEILKRAGIQPVHVHASATAGVLLYPETDFTMVRVGIGAYGIWPSRETQLAARERGRLIGLSPALTWKTRIVQVKKVSAGGFVGYGLTYQTRRTMDLAIVPVGYYDGYDRKLSNSGRALVLGQYVPVVGRVAMNMLMLDVTDCSASADDEVVLLGRQGKAEIRVEELAEKIGSIPYEVVSRINPLLPRCVV